MKQNIAVYIHGKGGSSEEALHYAPLFPDWQVLDLDYQNDTPWAAGEEIGIMLRELKAEHDHMIVIANSIGAFFLMHSDAETFLDHAYFISPIVDMEKLITDMIGWAGITEQELQMKKVIHTEFGEDLSWDYLCYVRQHPISWNVPTDILYGSCDNLTSFETIADFSRNHQADLTVMEGGEHWFHTDEQMKFLDDWIIRNRQKLIVLQEF